MGNNIATKCATWGKTKLTRNDRSDNVDKEGMVLEPEEETVPEY